MRLQQMLSEPTEPATPLIGLTVVKQKLYFCEENVNISKQATTQQFTSFVRLILHNLDMSVVGCFFGR